MIQNQFELIELGFETGGRTPFLLKLLCLILILSIYLRVNKKKHIQFAIKCDFTISSATKGRYFTWCDAMLMIIQSVHRANLFNVNQA